MYTNQKTNDKSRKNNIKSHKNEKIKVLTKNFLDYIKKDLQANVKFYGDYSLINNNDDLKYISLVLGPKI